MNANETVTRASRDCLVTSNAQPLHLERWTHRVCRWHSLSVPEGDITYLAKLPAATYIKPIPALQIIRTIIPLCGFGTPKNGNGYRLQNGASPAMVIRCI